MVEDKPKGILYVCASSYHDGPWIDGLREVCDVQVTQGATAVNEAMNLLRGGKHFDLIITGMCMPTGLVEIGFGETVEGNCTGLRFLELLRKEGIITPALVWYSHTSLTASFVKAGFVTLGTGEAVCAFIKNRNEEEGEKGAEDLMQKVRELLGLPALQLTASAASKPEDGRFTP